MNFDSITDTIQRALKSAGLDGQSPLIRGLEDTIRRALDSANTGPSLKARAPNQRSAPAQPEPSVAPGTLTTHRFNNAAGTRDYKLYVPSTHSEAPMPLMVMLHGCKQNPDDFAVGTQMNGLAESKGFVVVYPAQSVNANGSNCWNWFATRDQVRDGGEASIIAGIAMQVAEMQHIDRQRIFVAGLSAGAAMAVILGATHPDVFAGVGAHSGLPRGAAHDVASAFAAMSGGSASASAGTTAKAQTRVAVPTIVFHGDRDSTVAARNGWDIIEHARLAFSATQGPLTMQVEEGIARSGRAHTTTRFTDAAGHARIEHWLIHGGAHQWSGGDPRGSYTSGDGPDASAEMVRFFLAQ